MITPMEALQDFLSGVAAPGTAFIISCAASDDFPRIALPDWKAAFEGALHGWLTTGGPYIELYYRLCNYLAAALGGYGFDVWQCGQCRENTLSYYITTEHTQYLLHFSR